MPSAPQRIVSPLTQAAIFLVVSVRPDEASRTAVRSLIADLSGIVRSVEQRDLEGGLTCVTGFSVSGWNRIFGENPRPAELHAFREFKAEGRIAAGTPGDMLFHIRARRMDLCFELETQIMERIAGATTTEDETHGFRYFDDRGVIGFVDGTENPRDEKASAAVIVGVEDPTFAGGSYVLVQKYIHDLKKWNAIATEDQERIIGRKKLSDIELSDAAKPAYAHNALTTVVENGEEVKILRYNMPFGKPGYGEFGTYFIGYARSPRTIEQMLQNMVVGLPPGNYDRLLDVSHPVTGGLFFTPTIDFLEALA